MVHTDYPWYYQKITRIIRCLEKENEQLAALTIQRSHLSKGRVLRLSKVGT